MLIKNYSEFTLTFFLDSSSNKLFDRAINVLSTTINKELKIPRAYKIKITF